MNFIEILSIFYLLIKGFWWNWAIWWINFDTIKHVIRFQKVFKH